MTKVIKGEFTIIKDVKVEDVSLTCNTSLEVFNNEVNRLSEMDDDLFTYEFKVASIPCDLKMDDDSEHEADDDMGYDPSDVGFTQCCKNDGYCNGGNLLEAYHIRNSLHYQDLEWYDALEDCELKDKALRNKSIMEGLISDNESSNYCWKRWKSHEINYHNYDEGEYENETHDERHELCGIKTREVPVCRIKRYKMIKYSLNDEEEYVAVKEDEYDDLTIIREKACQAY
ncbi:hypothetical protein Tco_1418409 [Tanacetum coccineum]